MTAIQFEGAERHLARMGRRSTLERAGAAAGRVFAMLRQWRRRARDRADLAALDDRMIADIGISRAEAEFLGNKPFWRE
jgi:uncharacterized protein YjiS (DUF1127 family)